MGTPTKALRLILETPVTYTEGCTFFGDNTIKALEAGGLVGVEVFADPRRAILRITGAGRDTLTVAGD